MGLGSDDRLRELKSSKSEDGWWGFVVYRTTYSDDKAWQAFKAKFEQYRAKQVAAEEINALGRLSPDDIKLVQNSLRLVYVEDPSLQKADDNAIRKKFMRHCQAKGWSAGTRGRNQVCLKVDEGSMQSVVTKPAPGDADWENRYTVSEPDPEDADRIIVKQTKIETAYVNVVDRHYDNIPAALEPGEESNEEFAPNAEEDDQGGEEEEQRLDSIKVAISDVLGGFYSDLLSDLQLDELMLSPKTGIYSSIGMMMRYRHERDDDASTGGSELRLPKRLPAVDSSPTQAPQVDESVNLAMLLKQSECPQPNPVVHFNNCSVLYGRHKIQKALLTRDAVPVERDTCRTSTGFSRRSRPKAI